MSTQLQTQAKAGSKSSDAPTANNTVKRHLSSQRGFSAEMQRYPIQAKLTIGQPGDKYEQEADRVVDEVMRMPEKKVVRSQESARPALSFGQVPFGRGIRGKDVHIQRMCAECENEEEEEEVQMKSLAGQITPLVQRQVEERPIMMKGISGSSDRIRNDLSIRLNRSSGGGQSLSEADRSFMERRFGVDFNGVRVHNNNNAVQMSRELNAQAFTHGRDIYFGAGRYSPGTSSGKGLLAHELTHVVQQAPSIAQSVGLTASSGHYPMLRQHPTYQSFDVQDDAGFFDLINSQFTWLRTCSVGSDLLTDLDSSLSLQNRTLFIRNLNLPAGCTTRTDLASIPLSGQTPADYNIEIAIPDTHRRQSVSWEAPEALSDSTLASVHLGHELVHAWHRAEGHQLGSMLDSELAATGLAAHAHYRFSENRIRCAKSLPVRTWYLSPNDIDQYHREGYRDPFCHDTNFFHLRGQTVGVQPVPEDEIATVVRVFVRVLDDADREGYSRVEFTIRRTNTELVPGFRKLLRRQSREPAGQRSESALRAYIDIITINPIGQYMINAQRDESRWNLEFSSTLP